MADAMANINALIAQGPKPIQLDDPLGQMAKMYQIKSAQQTLTANEQKLAEANALKEYMKGRPDLTSPSTFSTMVSQFGEAGANLASRLQKLQGDQIVAAKNATELMKSSATSVMANPTLTNAINAVRSFGQRTGTNVTSEIERLMSIGDNPDEIKRWAAGHAVSADKLLPVFESRDLGGTREEYQRDPVSGKPIGAPTVFQKTPVPTTSPLAKVIAERDALPPGHPSLGLYNDFLNQYRAGLIAQDAVTGLWRNKATNEIIPSPSVAPTGQPGTAPLVPGIAPAGQPGAAPTARSPLDMMRTPQFQELINRGVVSTPQEAAALAQAMSLDAAGKPVNITVPNALAGASVNALAGAAPAGAAPSVNALAGAAPAGAPIPTTPVQERMAFDAATRAAYAGPEAETKKRHELLVDQYKDISKAAQLASKTLPALESNLAILDRGFTTGFGTEAMAAGAKVLGALGVQNAEKFATNSQAFLANATQAVLQRQLEQKGPQTEADAQRITQTGAQLGSTKEANKFILSVAKAQLQRDIDQRKFYDQWQKQNKTYDGAEDAWFSGEGGKSLFDTPALREYSSKTPTGGAVSPQGRPPLDRIFGAQPQR